MDIFPSLDGLWVHNDLGYWSVWYYLCGSHGLWHEELQVATIVSKVQTTSIFSVELTQFGCRWYIQLGWKDRSQCREMVSYICERAREGQMVQRKAQALGRIEEDVAFMNRQERNASRRFVGFVITHELWMDGWSDNWDRTYCKWDRLLQHFSLRTVAPNNLKLGSESVNPICERCQARRASGAAL